MTRIDTNTTRVITVAGLLTSAVGIGIAKAGGMEMPAVPPGAVLLVVGAVLLAVFRGSRWPAYVAILVALAEIVPSAITLGDLDGAGQAIGSVVRFAGALTALAGGVALTITARRGTVPSAPGQQSAE